MVKSKINVHSRDVSIMNQVKQRLEVLVIYGKSCHEDFVVDEQIVPYRRTFGISGMEGPFGHTFRHEAEVDPLRTL